MKVVVLGLDGFTWKTLDSGKVEMENLESLRKSGAWGRLRSTRPPNTVPAWITLATGVNPGKHGVFDFMRCKDGSLSQVVPINSRDIKAETIQQIVRRRGGKSIIMNLPGSTPALTDDITLGSFMSIPKDFISPQDAREIPEVMEYCRMPPHRVNEDLKSQLQKLLARARQRTRTGARLFQEDWDFFFQMYSESDMLQHLAFDMIADGRISEGLVHDIYAELDRAVGWFLDNMDEDTYLVVMSDHGFDSYRYKFSLKNFLAKKNALSYRRAAGVSRDHGRRQRMILDVSKIINTLNGNQASRKALDFMRKTYMSLAAVVPVGKFVRVSGYNMKVDVAKSSAMPITVDGYGVYINSRHKYRDGIVEDYEKELEGLIKILREEISPLTGKPTFKWVGRADSIYSGDCVKNGPDILIDLADHAIVGDGHFSKTYYRGLKNYHDPYGILAMSGPGIKNCELDGIHIMDIAPTVLNMLGMPAPSNMDGRVITEAFAEKRGVEKEDSAKIGRLRGKLGKLRKDLS